MINAAVFRHSLQTFSQRQKARVDDEAHGNDVCAPPRT